MVVVVESVVDVVDAVVDDAVVVDAAVVEVTGAFVVVVRRVVVVRGRVVVVVVGLRLRDARALVAALRNRADAVGIEMPSSSPLATDTVRAVCSRRCIPHHSGDSPKELSVSATRSPDTASDSYLHRSCTSYGLPDPLRAD
jgi:hypothetical protein